MFKFEIVVPRITKDDIARIDQSNPGIADLYNMRPVITDAAALNSARRIAKKDLSDIPGKRERLENITLIETTENNWTFSAECSREAMGVRR